MVQPPDAILPKAALDTAFRSIVAIFTQCSMTGIFGAICENPANEAQGKGSQLFYEADRCMDIDFSDRFDATE